MHFTILTGWNLNFLPILDLQLLHFQLKHQLGCALTAESPKNGGKIQIISREINKMHPLKTLLFWTSNFDNSQFLSQLTQERVVNLKSKLCRVANKLSFEIGRISVMRACETKRVRLDLYGTPCKFISKFSIALSISKSSRFLRSYSS